MDILLLGSISYLVISICLLQLPCNMYLELLCNMNLELICNFDNEPISSIAIFEVKKKTLKTRYTKYFFEEYIYKCLTNLCTILQDITEPFNSSATGLHNLHDLK